MSANIWLSVEALADRFRFARATTNSKCPPPRLILCSGGFDILTAGHARYLLAASQLRNDFNDHVAVLVNSDEWLLRKKGYVAIPLAERLEVVAAISGIDHVAPYDDGSSTVAGAIRFLRPDVFAKGGDRSTLDAIAEDEKRACEEVGCRLVLGVGGSEKPTSSSLIAARLRSLGPSP